MRVKIVDMGVGQHPSERVVRVDTRDGPEQLVVDERAICHQSLDVGFPVGQHNGHLLVELPRETFSGTWRVWVDRSIVTN